MCVERRDGKRWCGWRRRTCKAEGSSLRDNLSRGVKREVKLKKNERDIERPDVGPHRPLSRSIQAGGMATWNLEVGVDCNAVRFCIVA